MSNTELAAMGLIYKTLAIIGAAAVIIGSMSAIAEAVSRIATEKISENSKKAILRTILIELPALLIIRLPMALVLASCCCLSVITLLLITTGESFTRLTAFIQKAANNELGTKEPKKVNSKERIGKNEDVIH